MTVPPESGGRRLDIFLVQQHPEVSRSFLTKLIKDGRILVNKQSKKAGYRISAGDIIDFVIPASRSNELEPFPLEFPILYEDAYLLVLVKPPGLVVHPAAGNYDKTLVNGLLHHCGRLPGQELIRPGIVHRLDKDTSGVMVVAKTENTMAQLSLAFKKRKVKKRYQAILKTCPATESGQIDKPIGRHPVQRKKMAVNSRHGRYALTRYEIVEHLAWNTCLAEIIIETGRTHQIRVHMASINCPVLGDSLYGGKSDLSDKIGVKRQMLHACDLEFQHPQSGKLLTFSAPLWDDMQHCLQKLQQE